MQTVVTAQTMSTGGEGMQHNICKLRMCEKMACWQLLYVCEIVTAKTVPDMF